MFNADGSVELDEFLGNGSLLITSGVHIEAEGGMFSRDPDSDECINLAC